MRVRPLTAAAAAVLAAAVLAGCQTNVGVAANAGGQQISESQVGSYVTPQSKPVSIQGTQVAPKPFVLDILIGERFYRAVLAASPGGAPSEGQINNMVTSFLAGRSPQQAVEGFGINGYTPDFAQHVLVYSELGSLLNQKVQQGVNVRAIAAKVNFPVSVNPRYGTWDSAHYMLSTTPSAGLPGVISFQPPAPGSGGVAG
ncbi:MAG TPA: hypothetical protein VFH38_03740 [Jatrophihabitans sp.]|nr:hypothetical protein [Jatrophihabitans sp.]